MNLKENLNSIKTRIESAQKRIQELKKLIDYWLKNEKISNR